MATQVRRLRLCRYIKHARSVATIVKTMRTGKHTRNTYTYTLTHTPPSLPSTCPPSSQLHRIVIGTNPYSESDYADVRWSLAVDFRLVLGHDRRDENRRTHHCIISRRGVRVMPASQLPLYVPGVSVVGAHPLVLRCGATVQVGVCAFVMQFGVCVCLCHTRVLWCGSVVVQVMRACVRCGINVALISSCRLQSRHCVLHRRQRSVQDLDARAARNGAGGCGGARQCGARHVSV